MSSAKRLCLVHISCLSGVDVFCEAVMSCSSLVSERCMPSAKQLCVDHLSCLSETIY